MKYHVKFCLSGILNIKLIKRCEVAEKGGKVAWDMLRFWQMNHWN